MAIFIHIAVGIVVQGAFQTLLGEGSHWGVNNGWQTEIAIWNLGMAAVLLCIVRSKKNIERDIIPGLILLFMLLGINHLVPLIKSTTTPFSLTTVGSTNWVGFSLNIVAILCAGLVYLLSKPQKANVYKLRGNNILTQ